MCTTLGDESNAVSSTVGKVTLAVSSTAQASGIGDLPNTRRRFAADSSSGVFSEGFDREVGSGVRASGGVSFLVVANRRTCGSCAAIAFVVTGIEARISSTDGG